MSRLISLTVATSLSLLFVVNLNACSKPTIDQARKAEAEERFSDAYQLYSKEIFAAGNTFVLPELKQARSGKDLQEWIADSAGAYTKFLLAKVSQNDLRESASKLKILEPHLKFLENRLELESTTKLELESYIHFLKTYLFPDQKEVPRKTRNDATELFNKHISFLAIQGDGTSYVEGILSNPERNISVKYSISHTPEAGVIVLLAPGEWVSVSRIVPELSDPKDEIYRAGRDIRGRYAATFITVPDVSNLMSFRFTHRQLE